VPCGGRAAHDAPEAVAVNRTVLAATLLTLAVAVVLAGAPRAAGQTPVTGVLGGATALAPGASSMFFLNASGGPAAESNGNFTIRFWITGPDVTGGTPLPASPQTRNGNASGQFRFNVTAPAKEQTITLVVEITSTAGPRSEKATVTRAITVITPIVLAATFRNDGGSAAVNVPVKFFVDGKAVGTTDISRIEPKATGTAKLTWLPVGITPGTHTVRVEADLNRNGVIEQDKGEVVVVDVFYKKDWELTWPYAIVIMLATVSVSATVIRGLRRRR